MVQFKVVIVLQHYKDIKVHNTVSPRDPYYSFLLIRFFSADCFPLWISPSFSHIVENAG